MCRRFGISRSSHESFAAVGLTKAMGMEARKTAGTNAQCSRRASARVPSSESRWARRAWIRIRPEITGHAGDRRCVEHDGGWLVPVQPENARRVRQECDEPQVGEVEHRNSRVDPVEHSKEPVVADPKQRDDGKAEGIGRQLPFAVEQARAELRMMPLREDWDAEIEHEERQRDRKHPSLSATVRA